MDIVAGQNPGVVVRLGSGDFNFREMPGVAVPGAGSIVINDVDMDGHPDVIAGNFAGVSVLRGNGDGTFGSRHHSGFGPVLRVPQAATSTAMVCPTSLSRAAAECQFSSLSPAAESLRPD